MTDQFGQLAKEWGEAVDVAGEMAALRSLAVRLVVVLAEHDLVLDEPADADVGVMRRAIAQVLEVGRPVPPCRLYEFRLIDEAAHPVCDLCRWWRDPPDGEITRPA